jgi:hypothetical protein
MAELDVGQENIKPGEISRIIHPPKLKNRSAISPMHLWKSFRSCIFTA